MQSNQNRKRLMGINSYTAHFTPFLQATCERGFASMEESHLKVVEELQHRHRQEVERLLVERDGLLEEESAATATGEQTLSSLTTAWCFILKICWQWKNITHRAAEFPSAWCSVSDHEIFSQQSKPSRMLTGWSWRRRCRGDVSHRTPQEAHTWRTCTDSTGRS